jgi:hypothetical protein
MHISRFHFGGFGLSAKACASCVCVCVCVRMDAMTGRCIPPSAASLATAWCNGLQSSCAHLQSSVEKLQASVTQRCVNSIPSKNVCVCLCVCFFFFGGFRCPPLHSYTLSFLSMLCNFFFLPCFYLCDFFRSQ